MAEYDTHAAAKEAETFCEKLNNFVAFLFAFVAADDVKTRRLIAEVHHDPSMFVLVVEVAMAAQYEKISKYSSMLTRDLVQRELGENDRSDVFYAEWLEQKLAKHLAEDEAEFIPQIVPYLKLCTLEQMDKCMRYLVYFTYAVLAYADTWSEIELSLSAIMQKQPLDEGLRLIFSDLMAEEDE